MSAGLAWLILIIGCCFEIGFTTCLRFVDGFRNIPWTLSMAMLELASRTIATGTAYAVWGGVGALGTVLHLLVQRAGDDHSYPAHPRADRLHRWIEAHRVIPNPFLKALSRFSQAATR